MIVYIVVEQVNGMMLIKQLTIVFQVQFILQLEPMIQYSLVGNLDLFLTGNISN